MYELYLNLYHNLKIDNVLNTYYNKDVLLVSTDVIITSHSDADGDILSLSILDYQGQLLLRDFQLSNVLKEELEWHKQYHNKEASSNKDLYVDHKFVLYNTPYKLYDEYLLNGSIAKSNVGKATLDVWAMSMILEAYQQYCIENDYKYVKKDKTIALTRLTEHEANLLSYSYCRLVQEFVIEGIKHNQNGSKGFDIYFLKNIGNKDNERKIRKDMTELLGLSAVMIDKLLFIIRFATDNNNLIKACRNFISMYNKGRSPIDDTALNYWEKFIANNTYFGSLLKPIFDIKSEYNNTIENGNSLLESLFNNEYEFVIENNSNNIPTNSSNVEYVFEM